MLEALIGYDKVVQLAEQLSESEQNRLIQHLHLRRIQQRTQSPSRDWILSHLDWLRQQPVNPTHRLMGKYQSNDAIQVDAQTLLNELNLIATAWEQELEEFFNNES